MIADSTFLTHLARESKLGIRGPACNFFHRHRLHSIRTSIVSLSEVAVFFPTTASAWEYFRDFTIYPLTRGIAEQASDLDRSLLKLGCRLGENDNWIAAFCLFYRQPIISLDRDFDRVPGLRRIAY